MPEYDENDLHDLKPKVKTLIIIDDLMEEAKNAKIVSMLFTQGRHCGVSVILILQNAFPKGKYNTDIARNAMYMTLFKSPADREQIARLGQRIFAKQNNLFMNIYQQKTQAKYVYVVLDNTPGTNSNHQIISDVFGDCK